MSVTQGRVDRYEVDHEYVPVGSHCSACCQSCIEEYNAEQQRYHEAMEAEMRRRRQETMARPCPSCGAEPHRRCITASGRRTKETHMARRSAPRLVVAQ